MKKVVVVLFALMVYIGGCKKADIIKYDCTGLAPSYTVDVKPILDANCVSSGCHNSSSKRSGYDLSSYSGAKSASTKNDFMGSMQHLSGYSKMPKGRSQLSEANLKTISCWIENGTPQ